MTKSKRPVASDKSNGRTKGRAGSQARDLEELADVWPDPPVSEVGSPSRSMKNKAYLKALNELQLELAKLQEWIRTNGLRVVVLFEGRDAAGKGGAIKTISLGMNPRICRVVALGTPTERERSQWYFQRYVAQLPAAGEMVLFDRSWYNRAGVEHVMGFCTEAEYQEFFRSCPEFERMLIRSGIILVKYWFSVNDAEQERRFQSRSPTRQSAGSCRRWTSNRARAGSSIRVPRTRCSPTRT